MAAFHPNLPRQLSNHCGHQSVVRLWVMKIIERLKLVAGVTAAAVVIVPFLILKIVTMPFERPRKLTPEQVAEFLRKCIEGTARDGEVDYFISVEIADPRLNEVKDRVGQLFGPGWSSEETHADLEEILREVEAMLTPTTA